MAGKMSVMMAAAMPSEITEIITTHVDGLMEPIVVLPKVHAARVSVRSFHPPVSTRRAEMQHHARVLPIVNILIYAMLTHTYPPQVEYTTLLHASLS